MKTLVILAMMTNFLTAGCNKAAVIGTPAKTLTNVVYGNDPKQVYDIYLPANRSTATTPVMFLFHGGSWSGGDKRDFYFYIDSLKTYLPEYAFVNVNYRLANYTENKFPAQENDIKAAVNDVMNRMDEYDISDQIVFLGASAGGHLALLQAYKHPEPVRAKAVISFFGPTDMTDMYTNPANSQIPMWLNVLLGGNPTANKALYEQSSPVNYVTSDAPPTLLLQGGLDPLVSKRQPELLKAALDSKGVENELIIYQNEGHGWIGPSLTDSFQKIAAFVTSHVP